MATIWRKLSDGTIHNTISATGTYQPIGEWKNSFEFTAVMASGGQTATIQMKMGNTTQNVNARWPVMSISGTTTQTMSDTNGYHISIGLYREPVLVVTAISGTLTATLVPRSDDGTEASPLAGLETFLSPLATAMSFAKYVRFDGATVASMTLPPMKGRLSEQVYFNSGTSTLSLTRSKSTDYFQNGANLVTGLSLQPGYGARILDTIDNLGMLIP